jgi:polyisoprenoid-binding protein YceI
MKAKLLAGVVAAVGVLVYAQDTQPPKVTSLDVKARGAKSFYVDPAAGRNQVAIFSESTLEDFTIVCNEVSGEWQFNPQNIEQIKGKFSLKVEELRTGIELRDQHLVSPDWLDAAKYPLIVINIERAEEVKKTVANAASMVMVGTCSLHGVAHDVGIQTTVTYLDETPKPMERVKGDLIRLRADFQIKLADYHVRGPVGSDTIGLKVAEVLPIKASVFGSTEKPHAPLKLDKPGATTLPAGLTTRPAEATTRPAASEHGPAILLPPTRPAPAR